jgi:rhodanese-related sulfurtransferase
MSFGSGSGGVIDVDPATVWLALSQQPNAVIVDVRTTAEWSFVGLPDVSSLGKAPFKVEWQTFPSMVVNPNFVADLTSVLSAEGVDKDAPIYYLCRSGARSKAAAQAMIQAGWSNAYNIAGGFEGGLDPASRRGTVNGWKAAGLPWNQS